MKVLTKEQVIMLHQELVDAYGGTGGIRDEAMLDSALGAPFQSFGGQDAFHTVRQKAVRLGFGLIMNHPFIDGNKRIGVHAMLTVLSMNGIELEYTQKELYDVILSVAASNTTYDELLEWVLFHEI
jgi:death-on-curing protein